MGDVSQNPVEENPQDALVQRFAEPYNRYVESLEVAWKDTEIQQRGTEAHQRYLQTVQEALAPEVQTRVYEAWNAYLAVVLEALNTTGAQAAAQQAYTTYLQTLRQVWSEVDLTALEPAALAAIGQNLISVAALAAAAQGNYPAGSGSFDMPAF